VSPLTLHQAISHFNSRWLISKCLLGTSAKTRGPCPAASKSLPASSGQFYASTWWMAWSRCWCRHLATSGGGSPPPGRV